MGIGAKRLVVGAHYGLRDWLAQRITALLLAAYSLLLVILAYASDGATAYEAWASLFASTWMKLATLVAVLALVYHAWIGVRDIFMDYLKPVWLRITAYVGAILWLAFCALWAAQILWRV
ncbi:MAG: succinate dehydrogenase, hydrophobic membrane anchor protein [Sutterellaceae bacterium]|nr:succinate dehydrogenase, hydrophobic membrane anchor protein [Burkholderiaceae bacterium]MCX7901918.1 succinate dehydrogenase, hydrophobic membrane anchor protein [Burkholderiaceae bacterium]MDW8429906.1 succinate dehydrogenase, hydrophobic membrane anchor protein [Sutterellaceae bacterium]